jgi:isopentenyl phosphate kinase
MLKLGGSVITMKDRFLTPNTEAINRLAGEIADSRVQHLVIVHGGGSYGHPMAAKYKISEGLREKHQLVGFSETHNAMISLNKIIVKALIDKGLPAFSISPSSFILTRHGRIHDFPLEILTNAINIGFIPVLYGDSVLDYEKGFTILSGDQLISVLAVKLGAEKIIVGVDVDGLYTSDPKTNPSAQLIEHVTLGDLGKLVGGVSGSRSIDVTGGMMGKIFELTLPVMNGIEVMIVNALKPGSIRRALSGENVKGTKIVKG